MFYYVGDSGHIFLLSWEAAPVKLPWKRNIFHIKLSFISEHFQETSQCQYCLFYFLKWPLSLWFLHASSALQHCLLHSLLPGQFLGQRLAIFWSLWLLELWMWGDFLGHGDVFLKATSVASCWWFGCCSLIYLLHFPLEPEIFLCTSVWITPGGVRCFIPSF